MKAKIPVLLCIALLALGACEQGAEQAAQQTPVKLEPRCDLCGMNPQLSKGRFTLEFADGVRFDTCSGHCASMLAAQQSAELYRVNVYTYDDDEMTAGAEAIYVLGADIIPEGSMAPAVFAFSTPEAAETFIAEHGGHIADLEEVLTMSQKKEEDQPA